MAERGRAQRHSRKCKSPDTSPTLLTRRRAGEQQVSKAQQVKRQRARLAEKCRGVCPEQRAKRKEQRGHQRGRSTPTEQQGTIVKNQDGGGRNQRVQPRSVEAFHVHRPREQSSRLRR